MWHKGNAMSASLAGRTPGGGAWEKQVERWARVLEGVWSLPGVPREDWCALACRTLAGVWSEGVCVQLVGCDAHGVVCEQVQEGMIDWPRQEDAAPVGLLERLPGHEPADSSAWYQHAIRSGGSLQLHARPVLLAYTPLVRSEPATHLLCAARSIEGDEGERACFLAVVRRLGRRASRAFGGMRGDVLSTSEIRVLDLLVQGLSIPQIAARLSRSPHTVHDHVKSMHRKLGAHRRGDLILRAIGYEELDRPSSVDADGE